MSKTYDIVCHDCKVMLWIGQGPISDDLGRAYIYTDEAGTKRLRDFLFGHMYHRLEFGEDQVLDGKDVACEYVSLDLDD